MIHQIPRNNPALGRERKFAFPTETNLHVFVRIIWICDLVFEVGTGRDLSLHNPAAFIFPHFRENNISSALDNDPEAMAATISASLLSGALQAIAIFASEIIPFMT